MKSSGLRALAEKSTPSRYRECDSRITFSQRKADLAVTGATNSIVRWVKTGLLVWSAPIEMRQYVMADVL